MMICACAGTHWVFEMVHMLLNKEATTVKQEKRDTMLEFQSAEELNNQPSRRVISTHLHFKYLPEDLRTKRCQAIYLVRNPRDAMVS